MLRYTYMLPTSKCIFGHAIIFLKIFRNFIKSYLYITCFEPIGNYNQRWAKTGVPGHRKTTYRSVAEFGVSHVARARRETKRRET